MFVSKDEGDTPSNRTLFFLSPLIGCSGQIMCINFKIYAVSPTIQTEITRSKVLKWSKKISNTYEVLNLQL